MIARPDQHHTDSDALAKRNEVVCFVHRGMSLEEANALVCSSVKEPLGIRKLDWLPTPAEIEAATAEIRRGWSPAEEQSRKAGRPKDQQELRNERTESWNLPSIKVSDIDF